MIESNFVAVNSYKFHAISSSHIDTHIYTYMESERENIDQMQIKVGEIKNKKAGKKFKKMIPYNHSRSSAQALVSQYYGC